MRGRGGREEGEPGKQSWGERRAERAGREREGGRGGKGLGEKGRKQTRAEGAERGAGASRWPPGEERRRPGGRGAAGRRCQREAASGMQRPEAWPRPGTRGGAAAAPTGGPGAARPGAGASRRCGYGAGGAGAGGASRWAGRRGTCCRRDRPGRGGARAGRKFLRADSGGGRCGVRVGEVLEQSERAGTARPG